VGIISLVASFLAVSGGGADIVLFFSALGGLSGIAAVLTVYVTHRANLKKATVDDKSVAITELEKAVPGMGDIIKEWQNIVHHLQEELHAAKEEQLALKEEHLALNAALKADHAELNAELRAEIADLRRELDVYEHRTEAV
jgi:predicted RNase H-like nuclease (RuvC/YqgF family)